MGHEHSIELILPHSHCSWHFIFALDFLGCGVTMLFQGMTVVVFENCKTDLSKVFEALSEGMLF
jgi:hypothetical protein